MPLQAGPPPNPYGKLVPLTDANSSALVTYGVSQLAWLSAETRPAGRRMVRAGRRVARTGTAPACSRTVFVRPITPSTPAEIAAGSWTADELAKYSTPRGSR
ncbi:MAG: hypothetical protein ACRDPO_35000 [Streptosporangiaceae bacterium]